MQTDAFAANVDTVIEIARSKPCALMCAEAVPWRGHRSLVADALLVRGERRWAPIHMEKHDEAGGGGNSVVNDTSEVLGSARRR